MLPENKAPLISFRGKIVRKEDMMSITLIMLTQILSSFEMDEYKFGYLLYTLHILFYYQTE